MAKKSVFDRVPQRVLNVDQLNARGLALLQQGQFQLGADLLNQSLAKNPRQPEIHYNFGFALQQLGFLDSATQAYEQAIALTPTDPDALMARGHVLAIQKRFEEAVADFAKAVRLVPQNADAWNNYGNALLESAREPEAIEAYENALALHPGFTHALFNKGKALAAVERYAEAGELYEAALALNPNYEEAKWHLSWVRLVLGDFAEGWKFFESRWTVAELGNIRCYGQLPQWLGQESIADKSLLLYNEQGLGDTLQFCRYVPILTAMGARVSLAVQAPLVSLLKDQWTGVAIAESFGDVSGFDLATPLMSLPLALGTTLGTIPAEVPYIHVPPLADTDSHERPRIGLVWSGSTLHKNDKNRSMPLETLAGLFELPAQWICLQPEIRETDSCWLSEHSGVRLERLALKDFVDTAEIISGLDLVVTVDTSVAHLAGALGKLVWILLPTGCDYRWLQKREDSPWYPTARLFRQKVRGDWRGVIGCVKERLELFVADFRDRKDRAQGCLLKESDAHTNY